jgi:hypothetical protein
MATEEQRAAALIRDHVVPLMQANGRPQPVGPTLEIMWAVGPFRFALRTPSSPAALASDAPGYYRAQAQAEARRMLPYGLDIWHGEKVLSLQWDADELIVVSFQRGAWEKEALALR